MKRLSQAHLNIKHKLLHHFVSILGVHQYLQFLPTDLNIMCGYLNYSLPWDGQNISHYFDVE